MVSTRSQTAQTHLEDFARSPTAQKPKHQPAPKANVSRKRKSTIVDTSSSKPDSKRTKVSSTKTTEPETSAAPDKSDVVIINRAPVLQLWAASVAHVIHPNTSWETCLSAGSAVSSICAVAKGRSIGTIPEKDSDSKSAKEQQEKDANDEINVMQFNLRVKDGLVVVGSEMKGKPGSEEALKKKFGDAEYQRVRDVFDDALESWKGSERDLNQSAFGMYEEFRPNVSKGQKGWGRKGELNLGRVRSVVQKP